MTTIAAASLHEAVFTAPMVMAAASDADAWLGCESVHPLTWVPGMAAAASADRSSGRGRSRKYGALLLASESSDSAKR